MMVIHSMWSKGMIDERELIDRTRDACEQLTRYGGYVWSLDFVELLELLSEINDDLCHCRAPNASFDRAKKLLDKIASDRGQT